MAHLNKMCADLHYSACQYQTMIYDHLD